MMFPKRPKYGNRRKNDLSGRSFASGLERDVFKELCLLENVGLLKDIQQQDHVYLTDARILYIPDFKAFDVRIKETVWYEAKGYETPEWKLKKRLWEYYGPGRLRICRRGKVTIYYDDDIIPRRPKI